MKCRIGPFELDSLIAQGGMGEVWRGQHVDSNRIVAIKVLTGRMIQRPQFEIHSATKHEQCHPYDIPTSYRYTTLGK